MSSCTPTDLRLLGGALVGASQDRLARVVAVIDGLADRADADALLDRVRPRLRGLGLSRGIKFARILFLPLDGAIVQARHWRPGTGTVPRTALTPLAEAVHGALGERAVAIGELCAGRTMDDAAAIAAIGTALWPEAASALPEAPPASWREAGFAETDYAPMRDLCAAGWRHAVNLWPALQAAAVGPPEDLARRALAAPVAEGGVALDLVLRVLMARAARPASIAAMAATLAPGGTHPAALAAQRAVDDFLKVRDTALPGIEGGEDRKRAAAAAAQAACALIEDFEASPFLAAPARRDRVRALRRSADEACRSSFTDLMSTELLQPAGALRSAPEADVTVSVSALEETARALRLIEGSGRRLGGAESYDLALRSAAAAIAEEARVGNAGGGIGQMDALRLVEILAGPDVAQQMVPWPSSRARKAQP